MEFVSQIILVSTLLYALIALFFFAGLFYPQKGKNKTLYSVSVIIAARNEEKDIADLLTDLVNQSYDRQRYEVLVANDGSTDKTADVVADFEKNYPFIKQLHIKNAPFYFSPKKFALQQAVERAKGKIILSTDADCRVKPKWIATMVSYFAPNIGFVIGFSQFGNTTKDQSFWENLQAFDFMQLMGANAGAGNLGIPLAASGQNLGYRRKAYDQVKGYRSIAHRVSGDDVLLLQLIKRKTAWKSVFASHHNSFVTSRPQTTIREFINQRKRWASNGSYQIKLNFTFFTYLFVVYINNFTLLFGIPAALYLGTEQGFVLSCLLLKFLVEGIIAVKNARLMNRSDLVKYFPIWFLLQMPYVVIVGLFGSFGSFTWKGRKHIATTTK